MKVVDLTQLITEDMPVFEGTERPKLAMANTYEKDGFRETLLTMYSHTGTHIDCPGHLWADRTTLDEMPADQFVGKAVSVDCTDLVAGEIITMDYINRVRKAADESDFILFNTGWDKYWLDEKYFGDFPVINDEVVDYIIETKKKGVGIDSIGIDRIVDMELPIHKRFLKDYEMIIVENLTNLDKVGRGSFLFCALPLKFFNSDGAPTRAVAVLDV